MTRWTMARVEEHAPDAAARAAARRLARPGPWSETGSTEVLVWGRCQGSGATPYQVSIDLTGPAFRCTCPSRKFPCKHAVALLMLWVANDGAVGEGAAPAPFAAAWEDERRAREGAVAGPDTAGADAAAGARGAADPEARARRLARRVELMSAGMEDLATWTGDAVAAGLASLRSRPGAFWDGAAARLVDAQLPGLAERVRAMAGDVVQRTDWADHLLAELGRWYLATQAWAGRAGLSDDELGDLRAFVGWPVSAEERTPDDAARRWTVAGLHRTDDGRLQAQRTWLLDADGTPALVLDFAAVGGALRPAQVVGSIIEAAVVGYPGTVPRRVLLPDEAAVVGRSGAISAAGPIAAGLARVAAWRGRNPWADRAPLALAGARIEPGWVHDGAGDTLPLVGGVDAWPILARTGGHATDVFGELDGGSFRPLTLVLHGELVAA